MCVTTSALTPASHSIDSVAYDLPNCHRFDPVLFLDGNWVFAGKVNPGRMPLSSINTMLVDYALPFALFLYTARIKPADLASHATLIAVLAVVMLAPYLISLALSRLWFRVNLGHAAVRSVTIGMPNFAAVGLPILHAVYG